ncbi:CBS domain-containing protein [Enterococcus camelliae]|uniref:CBS domain-containing protein n=1 Tax=Enterococcus camelliae TaxID=453959 RepID=A0ABW5TJU4_9ENTE
MKLTDRQEKIIQIVKQHQPVSGEKVSELMEVSRATLRSDLTFLTLIGLLQATPKVGYTYVGSAVETFFFFDVFRTKVETLMMPPLLVTKDTSIRDAITTLFMYDVGSLYVIDEQQALAGVLSRKDLLRASMNTNIDQTPVAICMTRAPHLKVATKEMDLLEVASILQDFEVDSLPIVATEDQSKVIGKITKTRILNYLIQRAREAELKR